MPIFVFVIFVSSCRDFTLLKGICMYDPGAMYEPDHPWDFFGRFCFLIFYPAPLLQRGGWSGWAGWTQPEPPTQSSPTPGVIQSGWEVRRTFNCSSLLNGERIKVPLTSQPWLLPKKVEEGHIFWRGETTNKNNTNRADAKHQVIKKAMNYYCIFCFEYRTNPLPWFYRYAYIYKHKQKRES